MLSPASKGPTLSIQIGESSDPDNNSWTKDVSARACSKIELSMGLDLEARSRKDLTDENCCHPLLCRLGWIA
jgi:hypothetical protein